MTLDKEQQDGSVGLRRDVFRSHVISLGNDGRLQPDPQMAGTPEEVRRVFRDDFAAVTEAWPKKRLVLYVHGGLVSADGALNDIEPDIDVFKSNHCYLVAFVWRSGLLDTVINLLVEFLKDQADLKDLSDRFVDGDVLDQRIERLIAGSDSIMAPWKEMKENAAAASQKHGGARLVCEEIARLLTSEPDLEIHIVGHSAGAIFYAHLLDYLASSFGRDGLDFPIRTCTLWAPACTVDQFRGSYLPALARRHIHSFALFTLLDDAEQSDNCAYLYRKSLLYLVSNAFEAGAGPSVPLLGMSAAIVADPSLRQQLAQQPCTWIESPSSADPLLRCRSHGGFSRDTTIRDATLAVIRGSAPLP